MKESHPPFKLLPAAMRSNMAELQSSFESRWHISTYVRLGVWYDCSGGEEGGDNVFMCVCVLLCVCKVGGGPAAHVAAPNSQGVIWRSCLPPLARIDFWLGGFYVPAEFSILPEETPPCPHPFVFSANEILMRSPSPFFFHLFLHSFPLRLSLSSLLFCL